MASDVMPSIMGIIDGQRDARLLKFLMIYLARCLLRIVTSCNESGFLETYNSYCFAFQDRLFHFLQHFFKKNELKYSFKLGKRRGIEARLLLVLLQNTVAGQAPSLLVL